MLLVSLVLFHCVYSQVPPIPTTIEATVTCFNGIYTKNNVNPQTDVWWFQLDLLETQNVTFANCDTTFDTVMAVYNTSMVTISNPYCPGTYGPYDDCGPCKPLHEQFTIPNMVPGTYYLYIHHYDQSQASSTGYLSIATYGCISDSPTKTPTASPSKVPTTSPPTKTPTQSPSKVPTTSPTTASLSPTMNPSTSPTKIPTLSPVTRVPTSITSNPSASPTQFPSLMPSASPITRYPTGRPTFPTVSTSRDIWMILFKLILKYIVNFDPILDMEFKKFVTDTVKDAIYIQVTSSNAAENDLDNYEITVLTLRDTTDGVELNLKSSTDDRSLSDNIENVLKYNINAIGVYILTKLKEYLSDPSNGYDHINTNKLSLDIADVNGNIDDTGSVNDDIVTTETKTNNNEAANNVSNHGFFAGNMLMIIIIAASVFCICFLICATFCYLASLKKKRKNELTSLKTMNHLELQTHHLERVKSNEMSSDQLPAQKIVQSQSAFSSDGDIMFDGDLNSDSTGINNNNSSNHIKNINASNNEIDDDDSDSEELEQIQQTIQLQQQIWIQKQIEKQQNQKRKEELKQKQLQQELTQQQLLSTLPKAPSEILLGAQYTARMSMDPNGVDNLLNVDDQAEIDAYHEGVNDNIDDNVDENIDENIDDEMVMDDVNLEQKVDDVPGEEEELAQSAKDFESIIDQDEVEFDAVGFQPLPGAKKKSEFDQIDFEPLPVAPQINNNLYQTAGELENDNSD